MKFKDAFMKTSVKKAAVLSICAILFMMYLIQSVFVNQVFSAINRNITQFENIFKQDVIEMNEDARKFDEQRAYDNQMSEHNTDRLNLSILATQQEVGCFHEKNIARFEAMKSLAYVKRSESARRLVEFELKESRDMMNTINKTHLFDSSLCNKVDL
tara:strand:+ start:725 stop:1195 length:471 start_codon:yes stop_codon:yes gene_type:complete